MVTQHTRNILAASGQANPVVAKPSLGRWLKSQLPGGEKAMGRRELTQALTSPAMVRDIYKAAVSTMAGGAPLGVSLASREKGERAIERIARPAKAVAGQMWPAFGSVVAPVVTPTPKKAGELTRQMTEAGGKTLEMAANPLKVVEDVVKNLKGDDKEEKAEKLKVPEAWYPDPGQSWNEEPGGRYLSARYARQFGTWGQTYAGEGWRAIAGRGGWDNHLHPAYTQTSLRWVDRPATYRVGARTYREF